MTKRLICILLAVVMTVGLGFAAENPTAAVSTVNGAQMRTAGVMGLRFISTIEKGGDFDRVVEFGTVLVPSETVVDIEIGGKVGTYSVVKVPAVYHYAEDEASITFTAVITNIKEEHYKRNYLARAYAVFDNGSVVYSDTVAMRSLYTIATRVLNDTGADETTRQVAQRIVDSATPQSFWVTYEDGGALGERIMTESTVKVVSDRSLSNLYFRWECDGEAVGVSERQYLGAPGDWQVLVFESYDAAQSGAAESAIASVGFTVELLPLYELQVDGVPVGNTVQYGSTVRFFGNDVDVNLIWVADNVVKGIHPLRCTVETAGNWAVYIFEDTEAWTRYDFAAADEVLTFTVDAPAYSLRGEAVQGNIVSVVCSAEIPFYCSWYYGGEKMYDITDAYLTNPGEWTVYVFTTEEDQMSGDLTRAVEEITFYADEAEILPPEEVTFSLVRLNGSALPNTVTVGTSAKVICSDEGFPFYCGWYENGRLSHTNKGGGLHTAGEWTVYVFATEGDQMNENFDAAIASFTITVR